MICIYCITRFPSLGRKFLVLCQQTGILGNECCPVIHLNRFKERRRSALFDNYFPEAPSLKSQRKTRCDRMVLHKEVNILPIQILTPTHISQYTYDDNCIFTMLNFYSIYTLFPIPLVYNQKHETHTCALYYQGRSSNN